ncbi:MAG: SCO family protein [Chloroflexota bacterium]|nr:SCO family protein [Chloroflexota bacterium]
MVKPPWQAFMFGLTILMLAGCGKPYEFHGTVIPDAQPAPPITGTNWDGQAFDLRTLQGKVVIAFFGYTHCPDFCPMTLGNLNKLAEQLGEKADELAVVLVATDPERDTVEQLAVYMPAFNPAFYGVHVPAPALVGVKKSYGVYAEKNEIDDNPNDDKYFIDHSSYIYVIDKAGDWRLLLPFDTPLEAVRQDVEYLLGS